MTADATSKDKQITVDVPEDRVAEFYALYGHFLAGFPRRRRHRAHRCGGHHRGHERAEEGAVTETGSQPA